MKNKRIVIVGGVAGGASCAARMRRLDEYADIILLERGPYVSFANCGLPYRVGGVIDSDDKLLVANPELFRTRFAVDVRTGQEVRSIDREKKTARVLRLADGVEEDLAYDALVLSPGALPVKPPLPGIELEGIFTIRSIPDIQQLRGWMDAHAVTKAVIVGAGFIGLEMAENLVHLGLQVTVVEMLDQIMPPLDADVVRPLEDHLRAKGVKLALGSGVSGFTQSEGGALQVHTADGTAHDAGVVILAIGVRPDTALAKAAGLELGARGGIRVDEQMRTSDPSIYAVGDAVEVRSVLDGKPTLLALAGPANRQGRIAADAIAGRASTFRGVQGTSVVGLFDMAAGSTGWSEKALQREGITDYAVQWLHPNHHASYYPGAQTLHIKMIYRTEDGLLLGAQVVGTRDVARKIDVFAVYLQMKARVFDLEEAELAYSPQFGSAKDAVNIAGMMAANSIRGDHAVKLPPQLPNGDTQLLDVREPDEFAEGHLPNARNIPLGILRSALSSLDCKRPVAVYCHSGKRGYDAQHLLTQHGFQTVNLAGGWTTWKRTIPHPLPIPVV